MSGDGGEVKVSRHCLIQPGYESHEDLYKRCIDKPVLKAEKLLKVLPSEVNPGDEATISSMSSLKLMTQSVCRTTRSQLF